MPTLLAITPNPAIDRTIHVSHLKLGTANRATQVECWAGGKGLNVARAANALGCRALAVGVLGSHTGKIIADLTAAEGLDTDWYWLESGETRISVLLTHDDMDATIINEPGPVILPQDDAQFRAHVQNRAGQCDAVTFSGSLPPNLDPQKFYKLACSLVLPERNVYLDATGKILDLALAQPNGLCIKVNKSELATGLQQPLVNIGDVVEAGNKLLNRGATLVAVTLGKAGALVVTPDGCWQASAPSVNMVSTIGSGDSFLAGFAVALLRGEHFSEALKLGVVCGAANALNHLPGRFETATVEKLSAEVLVKELEV